MITSTTSGVWILWDTYAKRNAERWIPDAIPLFAFGNGSFGVLGQNDTTLLSAPIQIPGTTWSSIASGSYFNLATKSDGTLWAWGRNLRGQLGQNNTTDLSSPVQIPGTSWSFVNASCTDSRASSFAIKTDGTLWAWGNNGSGELGQNNRTEFSSPVQVPGTTWRSVSASYRYTLATKTDGTLWSWGYGGQGRLGQSSNIDRSSPVQIPGTTWSSISAGYRHSLATQLQ